LPKYEYCRYWKILGNTGYTSIADTGRFWKILVIPVLQILEDSGKYW
jgi:nitric oxide reductase large subunit